MKKLTLILIFSSVCFFTVSQASGQDSYNIFTLEYFTKSIESLMSGDFDNAILNITNVIRRDPESSVAYTIRARAHFEKGNMEMAIADSNQAIRLDSNNVGAYSIRANAYVKANQMNRAISDWERILRINPENTEAKQNLDLARQQALAN